MAFREIAPEPIPHRGGHPGDGQRGLPQRISAQPSWSWRGLSQSSGFAQAYHAWSNHASPDFNFNAGYGNYAEGAFIAAPNITGGYANVVSSLELGQPGPGPALYVLQRGAQHRDAEPERQLPGPRRIRLWSIYNGSPYNNFFAGNVGIGYGPANQSDPRGQWSGLDVRGCLDERLQPLASKKDIRPLPADEAMETLSALVPVTFKYKIDDEAHVGFIAEDVPDLVATKDRKGLSAMDIVAVLAKVVQQQQTQLSDQRKELDALKAQLERGRGN